MSPTTFVILSGVLTYGTPLSLAVYEIWSLRRPGPRDDGPPRDPPRIPWEPKPLPACLLPQPERLRERELEDA